MVRALKGVPKNDDRGDAGIEEKGEVQETWGHFVNFVDDEDTSMFEKGSLPGGNAPVLAFGEAKLGFPVSPEIDVWNGDPELLGVRGAAEEGLNGTGFAAASKAREMAESDGTGRSKIDNGIKRVKNVGRGRKQLAKNTVKVVLHVGSKGFGARKVNRIVMESEEGKKRTVGQFMIEEGGFEVHVRFGDRSGECSNESGGGRPMPRRVVNGMFDVDIGGPDRECGVILGMDDETNVEEVRNGGKMFSGVTVGACFIVNEE